jgi:hypothetical protein
MANPIPPFRATGRGLAVDNTRFEATADNANAVLTAQTRGPSTSPVERFYLFVTRVRTGWSLAGETGQTRDSRAFYPRNLSQADVVIEGISPSQHQFDKLVEFVQSHHLRIVSDQYNDTDRTDSPDQTQSVTFTMGRPAATDDNDFARGGARKQNTYRHAPAIRWDLAITRIDAGHERFQFQPRWALTCKVLNDRLQQDKDVEFEIARLTAADYGNIFTDRLDSPLPEGPDFSAALPKNTQEHVTFSGVGGGGGTGGAGSTIGNNAPGDPSTMGPYQAQIAAQAPGYSDPAIDELKKHYPPYASYGAGWPCVPPELGKCWFGGMKDEGRVFGAGHDQSGTNEPNCQTMPPHIHVKYRQGGTVPVFI